MKPKTKFQHRVVTANTRLLPISPSQLNWAVKNLTTPFSFRSKGKNNVCSDCGTTFDYDRSTKYCKCPQCGKKLLIKDTRKRKEEERIYFSTMEVVDDLQVQRVFLLNVAYSKGEKVQYGAREMVRLWTNGKGSQAVTARRLNPMSYYRDCFVWDSDIELRNNSSNYEIIADVCVASGAKFLPEYTKRGVSKRNIDKFAPNVLLSAVLSNPHIETMLKAGREKDVSYFLASYHVKTSEIWDAYKITLRRNYEIEDISLWVDLVLNLKFFGKDIRNQVYVCPQNLKYAHDYWHSKREDMENKMRIKRERELAIRNEQIYKDEKSKYFDIEISDGEMKIIVLKSVKDFYEEGKAMHHCVSGYWNRKRSLILSARIDGVRIETIEVSLDSLKIIQSRAVCNGISDHHERILNLVNANIDMIASRITA